MTFDDCFVPAAPAFDDPVVPDIGEFLRTHESLINLPYTAVCLGVGWQRWHTRNTWRSSARPRVTLNPWRITQTCDAASAR